jgi:thioesterase domain-containing protein
MSAMPLTPAYRQLAFWLYAVGRPLTPISHDTPAHPTQTDSRISPRLHRRVARLAMQGATTVPAVMHAGVAALLSALTSDADRARSFRERLHAVPASPAADVLVEDSAGGAPLAFTFTEHAAADGSPGGIDCQLRHSTDLPPLVARAILAHLGGLLDAAATDPDGRVDTLMQRSYGGVAWVDEPHPGGSGTAAAAARAWPRNVLQDQIAAVWEHVLGIRAVGVDEDFFALGGTRAAAELMLTAIEYLCGVRPRLPDAADATTVHTLAREIVGTLPPDPILEIQAGVPGARAPLFFLHGDLGGGGFYVRELGRALGQEQPVITLQQHGLDGRELPSSIEAMAADHLERLRARWPHGPYVLGGHCNGATIAFELARQLAAGGEHVPALVLIEPPIAAGRGGVPMPPLAALAPEQMRGPDVRYVWLFEQYSAIVRRYHHERYDGRVGVFRARFGEPGRVPDAAFAKLGPRVEVATVPGNHISALGRHVRKLGAAMSRFLEQA